MNNYRVQRFMATSENEETARIFLVREKKNPGTSECFIPVLFVVHLNPTEFCLHTTLLEQWTTCGGENEWLFPPYSAFTVLDVASLPETTSPPDAPIVIQIEAAPDN